MKRSAIFQLVLGMLGLLSPAFAWTQVTVQLQEEGHYYYPPYFFNRYSGLTPVFDELGRDHVYVASVEKGLVVFDVSQVGNPFVADSLPPSLFQGRKVMTASQVGSILYLGIGSFWSPEPSGLAIVDVSNPTASTILGQWDSTAFDHGCAEVLVDGNFAYLALLEKGVAILDISQPSNVRFLSHILPDTTFGPPPYAPGARGFSLRNDTLLVAYDAGGLRAIDVHDKYHPIEIGKYVNTSLRTVANPAYNKVLRVGNYAWVPLDYCGLEVIDVSDPTQMQPVAWYNPWGCNNSLQGHGWSQADYHLNEISLVTQDSLVYVSGGDKEVLVFDARFPQQPLPIGDFGAVNDTIVAWGADARADRVAIALHYNAFDLPNRSKVGGLRMLRRSITSHVLEPELPSLELAAFPVPADVSLHLTLMAPQSQSVEVVVTNPLGQPVWQSKAEVGEAETQLRIPCAALSPGIYLLKVHGISGIQRRTILVQH